MLEESKISRWSYIYKPAWELIIKKFEKKFSWTWKGLREWFPRDLGSFNFDCHPLTAILRLHFPQAVFWPWLATYGLQISFHLKNDWTTARSIMFFIDIFFFRWTSSLSAFSEVLRDETFCDTFVWINWSNVASYQCHVVRNVFSATLHWSLRIAAPAFSPKENNFISHSGVILKCNCDLENTGLFNDCALRT